MADLDDVPYGARYELERLIKAAREGKPFKPGRESILDSDIMASIIAAGFTNAGYKVRFKFVRQPQVKEFHHVFVEVLDPATNEWIAIDPQRTEPGDWAEERTVTP